MEFKNGKQLEDFHIIILRLEQEIILYLETVSPTRLILQYTKSLSKSNKLKVFIAPKMKYLITFLDNNGKPAVYTGVNIHGIYRYLEMIGPPSTLTTSGQSSNNFGPSSSTNNDTATLHTVIEFLCIIHQIIYECCGRIGHKAYACIIYGHKFPSPSLRINISKLNALHGNVTTDTPRERNSQPPTSHFKYMTSTPDK